MTTGNGMPSLTSVLLFWTIMNSQPFASILIQSMKSENTPLWKSDFDCPNLSNFIEVLMLHANLHFWLLDIHDSTFSIAYLKILWYSNPRAWNIIFDHQYGKYSVLCALCLIHFLFLEYHFTRYIWNLIKHKNLKVNDVGLHLLMPNPRI